MRAIMAKRRAADAPLGLTSNGLLLTNALPHLDARQTERLRRAVPKEFGTDWFLGTVVPSNEVAPVLVRLDDAAAEAAARLAARSARRSAKPKKRRARAR
jgi:hypothetical protein